MTNVVVHPKMATASAKVLTRRIEAGRGIGIAGLQEAIKSLARIANGPRYGLARHSVEECESVLSELESLDPAVPPPVENVHALGRRLESLVDELCERILRACSSRHEPARIDRREVEPCKSIR